MIVFYLADWPRAVLYTVVVVAVVAGSVAACHLAGALDRYWWWRKDNDRTMRREMER